MLDLDYAHIWTSAKAATLWPDWHSAFVKWSFYWFIATICRARPAGNFLSIDIVIGEGEKRDARYLITRGHVNVYREQQADNLLVELKDGSFFGEMALSGDQVRTATVKVVTPTTLLSLRRKDVLALAEIEPFLRERLEDASDVRQYAADHD